jgi:hypothetical protein
MESMEILWPGSKTVDLYMHVVNSLDRFITCIFFIKYMYMYTNLIRIKKSKNCILQACYKEGVLCNDSWFVNIHRESENLGLPYVWNDSNVHKNTYKIIEQRTTYGCIQTKYYNRNFMFTKSIFLRLIFFVYCFT